MTCGIRQAGREPGHPHMPSDFNLNLTRTSADPGLASTKLLDAWPHLPADSDSEGQTGDGPAAPLRAPRRDGWDAEKERLFVATLADTGVVADACRACGMSRNSAYERRRSASGRGFALAWDAASLIARRPLGDDVMSRARHGVIDRVYRNGELVAERHRYDNRLTMAVLTRLDRLAEGMGENAPVIRAVAQEFDRFLDLLPEGVAGAEAFVAERFPPPLDKQRPAPPPQEPPTADGMTPAPDTELALLARCAAYEEFGVGLPSETRIDDLDPAAMPSWSAEQWERAEFSGFLRTLREREWPDAAREPAEDGANGSCHVRHVYLRYHPHGATLDVPKEDDFAGCGVWEDSPGEWQTDFPPPEGFDGYEEGEPGEEEYRRELTPDELDSIGVGPDSLEAERLARLAEQHAARDRFFGFDSLAEAQADKDG